MTEAAKTLAEAKEAPDSASFMVDVSFADLSNLFDEGFRTALDLRKRKTDIQNVLLFSERLATGEEVALAITCIDENNSVISLAALDEYMLYTERSDNARTLLNGLVECVTDRIQGAYPRAIIGNNQTISDAATLAVTAFSTRKSKTSFTRARTILGRLRHRVFVAVSELNIPKAYYGFGCLIGVMMAAVYWLHPPDLISIEVILILGLLLDLGFPIYQSREEHRSRA